MTLGMPVGLIGAYERDNFGDILFLERTRRYLDEARLEAKTLAPFRSLTERLTGAPTTPVTSAMRDGSLGAIWTVGGEVGGVAVHSAYLMLDPETRATDFHGMPRGARRALIRQESGAALTNLAYLPRPSAYPDSWAIPSIVNSVGVSGMLHLQGSARLEAVQSLRDADYVSVREEASAKALDSLGVKHVLAPDLVHTLRRDMGSFASRESRRSARASRKVLVQMNQAMLAHHGPDRLARELCAAPRLKGADVRLFVAGSAPSHDSLDLYSEVASRVNDLSPAFSFSLSPAQSPMDKAREIATSELVVTTSLHALIISMSFDVPHVGLFLNKLSRYATTWGDPMPTAVNLDDLPQAISRALDLEEDYVGSGLAERLADEAHSSVEAAMSTLLNESPKSRADRRVRRENGARVVRKGARTPRIMMRDIARSLIRPLS